MIGRYFVPRSKSFDQTPHYALSGLNSGHLKVQLWASKRAESFSVRLKVSQSVRLNQTVRHTYNKLSM